MSIREGDARASPVHARDVAVRFQDAVRASDRGARTAQLERKGALTRETLADGEAAVEDQRPDLVCERRCRGAGDVVHPELFDET